MKKKKKINLLLPIWTAVIILAIICVVLLHNKKDNPLIGNWTTDGVTIYTFNKDNTGALKVSLGEYKFTYTQDDKEIFVDFENEKSEDTKYTYTIKGDKLVLKSVNGTFNFERINN